MTTKERPILFSAPMVRALLAGTKTQTRRVINGGFVSSSGAVVSFSALSISEARCRYGQPGDRLWVREAHSIGPGPGVPLQPGETAGALRWPHITYTADGAIERRDTRWKGAFGVGRPSIHMHRWASRILLDVTEIRVERLQDITEADCLAEGIDRRGPGFAWYDDKQAYTMEPVTSYRSLWESINGADSWEANPLVGVMSFRRVD